MNTFEDFSTRRDVEELLLSARLSGDEESLSSVTEFIRGSFSLFMVKSNPKRKVFRLVDLSGRELFLKLFAPQKFPFNILRPYAGKEYKAAKELEKASVPVIHYHLWGKGEGNLSFCISEGVQNAFPAREFFFHTVIHKETREFLLFRASLNFLIRSLYEKHFLHPDFHTGNMIFSRKEKKMYLLDPWGVRETFFCMKKAKLFLCSVWRELYDFLTDDLIITDMVSASLCEKKIDGLSILEKVKNIYRKKAQHQISKIHKRMLTGHYRYTTVINTDEDIYTWRHTFWYAPPEKFEIEENWEKEEVAKKEDAEKLFLHSMDHPAEEKIIVLMVQKKNGENLLYYAENPCKEYLQDKINYFASGKGEDSGT